MKAMIFAAGLGTRLKPLTDHMPKALVPVAGRPMLEHVILKLKEAGFTELVINIHHFGEQIIDFLKANQNFGLTIHISDERDRLLDTGGGIKKAATFMEALRLVTQETHVADVRSCVLHPASTTHRQLTKEELEQAGVPENLVRLSVGIENPDDIIADLEQALAKI